MKALSKILALFMLFFTMSCEDKITELNVDPDTSPVANDAQVLTSSIGYLGYIVDVDLNFDSFLWAQYYTWGIGVSIGNAERYVAEPSDHDTYWERAYANALEDIDYLENSESPAYRGVARVLKAYIYQGLVDHFGDVPYSEANSGNVEDGAIVTPVFDDAAAIYDSLNTTLITATAELNKAIDLGLEDIGNDDVIFEGDLEKWLQFANSLRLRVLMRTSEVDAQTAEVTELINSGSFIEEIGDLPAIPYTNAAGNQNPMFARAEWGVGDFYFASNATLNVLNDLGDPRGEYFYDKATDGDYDGQLHGIDQGTIDDEDFTNPSEYYSGSSSYAYDETNDVILMSPWEVWFLRAEAAARYNTSDDDVLAFETAITENFNYLGAPGAAAYIASLGYDTGDALDTKLNLIGVQKWISLNGTQEDEGWIEARRFDRDGNRIFTEGIWQKPPLSVLGDGKFPHSWLYPAQERSLNPNAPLQRTLLDKIFWDN